MIIRFIFNNKSKFLKVCGTDDYLCYQDFINCAQAAFCLEVPLYLTDHKGSELPSELFIEYVEQCLKFDSRNFELHVHIEPFSITNLDEILPNQNTESDTEVSSLSSLSQPSGLGAYSQNSLPCADNTTQRDALINIRSVGEEKLIQYIKSQEGGITIFEKWDKNKILSDTNLRKFVRYVCQHIVLNFGYWPTTVQKIHYARLCIDILPTYKNMDDDKDYGLFYDEESHTGFLFNRLKHLQKTHREAVGHGKNKTKTGSNFIASIPENPGLKNVEFDPNQYMNDIEFLKNASVKQQRKEIIEKFKATINYRKSSKTTILNDFPVILHIPELILLDFELGPKLEDIILVWKGLECNICAVYESTKSKNKISMNYKILKEWPETVISILKLIALLPPVNQGKGNKSRATETEALTNFCIFVPLGTSEENIRQYVKVNPQLVGMGANKMAISSFCIVVDKIIISLATNSFLEALHYFFAIHYVLNLEYHPTHCQFFKFVQVFIYKMDTNIKLTNSIKALKTKLKL